MGSCDIIQNEINSKHFSSSVKESINTFVEIAKTSSIYLIEVIENMMKYSRVLNEIIRIYN